MDSGPDPGFESLHLSPVHVALLQTRAIKPQVAAVRGVFTARQKRQLGDLGFKPYQQITPSFVIPMHNVLGERINYANRPDTPRIVDGKPAKYEPVAGSSLTIDVPLDIRTQLINPRERLVITEGPLKADAAVSHGLVCIAVFGVWNFARREAVLTDWNNMVLKDRDVFVAFDSDVMTKPPVHMALEQLQEFLKVRHATVWIVHLPSGPDGSKVGLDDFIAHGHSGADVLDLADHELPALPLEALRPSGDDRIPLDVGQKDLACVTPQAWDAVKAANDPPRHFRHGTELVRLDLAERDGPRLVGTRETGLRYTLTRAARCYQVVSKGEQLAEVPAIPPDDLLEDMFATPDPPVPRLSRIVEAPVFGADGSLYTEPGYHPGAETYYAPPSGFNLPAVPQNPSPDEITEARAVLDELFDDFPFKEKADRAHALCLLLLPFVRDLIDGPTPMHLIEAPEAGTGKGLLVTVALLPALGRHIPMMASARSDEEWRKRITSVLRAGRGAVCIDNVRGVLDSGTLASALTARMWEDRILGQSQMLLLPVRCIWSATGNNPFLSTEIARRCIRIRLDAKQDRPWQRGPDQFRHELPGWAVEHRGELAWAALTLGAAWLAAGRPKPEGKTLGSYEEWSSVLGGILQLAAVPGFLENLDALYERADIEGSAWRAFVASWWEQFRDRAVLTKELLQLARDTEGLVLRGEDERAQGISLGKQLMEQCDRVIDGYQIVRQPGPKRASLYHLVQVNVGESGECRGTHPGTGNATARTEAQVCVPDSEDGPQTFTTFTTSTIFTEERELDPRDQEELEWFLAQQAERRA